MRVTTGKVKEILLKKPGRTEILVQVGDDVQKAMAYTTLTGDLNEGDIVALNTSAVDLELGTGGYHFVLGSLYHYEKKKPSKKEGHLMKLRYTPLQFPVQGVEEEHSPHREKMEGFESLSGMPVIVGSLHSQLAPAAAVAKKMTDGKVKIAYVMTDRASLPAALSRLLDELREKNVVDTCITTGQAFGGDYETVNVYTGLICAKEVAGADIAIVSQGPGSVGTNTPYGFSGVEQGEIVNAVNILGGLPVAIPRISFADSRMRHYGVSHHTLTALGRAALTPCFIPVPEMDEKNRDAVLKQFQEAGIGEKHIVRMVNADMTKDALTDFEINVDSMGRSFSDDPFFFKSAGAAGLLAVDILKLKEAPDA